MVHYSVEVLAPTFLKTETSMKQEVQGKLDAYVKAGWHFHSMATLTGFGALSGMSIGPFLIMVFEGQSR